MTTEPAPDDNGLRLSVSISQKVNLKGPHGEPLYEDATAWIRVEGIGMHHSEEDIAAMVDRTKVVFPHLTEDMQTRVRNLRKEFGW